MMMKTCVVVLIPKRFFSLSISLFRSGRKFSFLSVFTKYHSRLNPEIFTHQYCEFLRLQFGSERINVAVDAVKSFSLTRLTVGFVKCDSFGNVELSCGEILYGCLGCDVFTGLVRRRRIHQVDKLLYCLQMNCKEKNYLICLLFWVLWVVQPSTISLRSAHPLWVNRRSDMQSDNLLIIEIIKDFHRLIVFVVS